MTRGFGRLDLPLVNRESAFKASPRHLALLPVEVGGFVSRQTRHGQSVCCGMSGLT